MLAPFILVGSLLCAPATAEERAAIDPDDPQALVAYATARKRAGDADGHLAYLFRAVDATERLDMEDKERRAAVRVLEAKIGAADRASKGLRAALQKVNVEFGEVLRLYGRNPKRTRNALDVAGRILAFDPEHGTANQVLSDLLEDADDALKRDVARALARKNLRRTRAFRGAWEREHGSWDAPGVARTDGYYVRSTIGFSTVERAANALEQVSHFYRSFYGVAPEGNQFGRTKVYLYRTRAEFEELAPSSSLTARKGVKGFLRTTGGNGLPAFGLYSYDPLDDGMARGNLWSTLFHEASHQYMALAAGTDSPTWLNEGMACYFEGTVIDARGEVQVGLPAMRRLLHLTYLIRRDPLMRALRARDGIDGEQYAVVWGIVYFLHHYQSDDGTWPYRDSLHAAIKLSRSQTGDPYGVFRKTVLEPNDLEIATLKKTWVRWIEELAHLERDPAAAVQWHRQRAERFEQQGNLEAAEEAYRQVRVRAPDDAKAPLALARISATRGDEDVTLMLARRALAEAIRVDDPEAEELAEALARSVDKAGFVRLRKAERKYREQIRGHVRRHLEKGRPMTAFAVAERFLDRVLGESHAASVARAVRLGDSNPVSRVLAPFDGETMVGLVGAPGAFRIEDGTLVGSPNGAHPAALYIEDACSPSFELTGELRARDAGSIAGFVVSFADTLETTGFATRPVGGIASRGVPSPFSKLDLGDVAPLHRASRRAKTAYYDTDDFEMDEAAPAKTPFKVGEWTPFAFSRSVEGRLRLTVGGATAASFDSSVTGRDVSVGLLIASGEITLRGLRLVERGRL